MTKIEFTQSTWQRLEKPMKAYLGELGGKNDGFHSAKMFDAEPYAVYADAEAIGFCSLMDGWDGGKMLTAFYIAPESRRHCASALESAIEHFHMTAALVASNDGPFVAAAFERMRALGATFEMQAYNHIYGKPKRPPEFGRDKVAEVPPEEYDAMNALTENQWDGCFGKPNFRFYAIRENGETLGYGAIERLPYEDGKADIGNFTLPAHRRKGVGRSMLIHLARIAIEQGLTPVAGCWHGNKESILTLASSGFIPESRLFYVKFV